MFFFGLGTGLGTALVVDGTVVPLELCDKKLKRLPERRRIGDNANAFLGGFPLWEEAGVRQ